MIEVSVEQVRSFRLISHHLDRHYPETAVAEVVGASGMVNTPPGAWETALFNRIPSISLAEAEGLLYDDKLLLQAWSLRGAPVVFPADQSAVFLTALAPVADEPWIYTRGIGLALDYLGMREDELFALLLNVIGRLDGLTVKSKAVLDQAVADWMGQLLPEAKQGLWGHPSMYGSPDTQTVGGAVASFLLRPAAFSGLVVFGRREGISPTFTSYQNWLGHAIEAGDDSAGALARKFLHCYGPATLDAFVSWLGASKPQGQRLWGMIAPELEPVRVDGRRAFILSDDLAQLTGTPGFQRDLLLLGGHDPYLDQRDRAVLQADKSRQRQIWRTVANPGAVVYQGQVIGIWAQKKKGAAVGVEVGLWAGPHLSKRIEGLIEAYAAFKGLRLTSVNLTELGS